MSAKPLGVLAMDPHARATALPPAVLDRLARVAEVDADLLVTDFADAATDALAAADFLVTGWGCPPLDDAAVARLPRLRLVAHAAGSVKHHVTDAVWRRGIAVSSAAAANAEPVAQYTRAVIALASRRAFGRAAGYAAHGAFTAHLPDTGYAGRVIGIVGASRIGRRVAELVRDFGGEILIADPHLDGAAPPGTRAVELDELCRFSDVVTVHAPQLPQTYRLIDDGRLRLMRDGAVLVNTARGSLVDTEALVAHCRAGRLDAVLDVTDPEPLPAGHPLLRLPNVWVTPHVAGAQGTEIALLGEYAVAEVARFFAGERLLGEVRREQLFRLA